MSANIATPDSPADAGSSPSPSFGLPQSPGWYWSRIKALTCDAVTLHRVDWCDHSKGFVIVSRYDEPLPIDRYPADQWYGPLTPPHWPNDQVELPAPDQKS